MVGGRTFIHAIIGAVVGVVLSFIPFSTVIGGAVAGFLEGPDGREGALAGALAGAITFVPFVGLSILLLGILGFGMGVAAVPLEGFAVVLLMFALGSSMMLLYTVGLALLGGYLGAYLARKYPRHRTETRRTIGMREQTPTERPPRPPRDRYGGERRRPPSPSLEDDERTQPESARRDAGDDADAEPERERTD